MGTKKSPTKSPAMVPTGYPELLADLKQRIQNAQIKAAVSVNRELVLLFWHIGREILTRQERAGWGAKVIDRLADDLRRAFPQMKGFSPRNLKYMRAFAEAYPDKQIVQQAAAQIPWFHNCALLDKVKDARQRQWYIRMTIEHGWSRNVLIHQVESDLYHRQGKAATNFSRTLPRPQSDLAENTIKDPYIFDFLDLGKDVAERQLEKALLAHIREFLLELGVGFAFVGSQYHLEVGDADFFIDLLFYHLKLRAFVVIDLKIGRFMPEHAGKMNFYLSAVDDLVRHADDQPTIGIILCKSKDEVVAEYALRDMKKPIGVAGYQLTRLLPSKMKTSLPTIEALESELAESDDPT